MSQLFNKLKANKKSIFLVFVLLLIALGATAWGIKRYALNDRVAIADSGPFVVQRCVSRLHDDKPALAVLLTQPVKAGQDLDKLIQVFDLTDQSAAKERAVEGSWISAGNPRVVVFPFVQPGHRYRVQLAAALQSAAGQVLAQAHECTVASDEMSPSYFFASKGTVLPAGLNGGLPVVTVNVPEVDVQFLRIPPMELAGFIAKITGQRAASNEEGEEGGYGGGSERNRFKGQTSGWQLNELRSMAESVYNGRFITSDTPNSRKVTHLPVEKINELKEPGIYVAVMSRPGVFDNDYQVTYFYVSDIGLHVRRQLKQTDVFTSSLRSARPQGDVALEVRDEKGKVLLRAKTDGEGHGVLPGLPPNARLLLAHRGKEMSIVALQEPGLDLAEFDIGGHLPRDAKLFAWAGRDLYRPGEKFTVSLLARDASGLALAPAPIKVDMKKPSGDVVSSSLWQPDPRQQPGYLQQTITLPPDAATGQWSLEFRADPAAKRADTVWSFQVEEFLPERMKLTLQSETAPLSADAVFRVTVQGDYLYGSPAAGNRLLGSRAQERARVPLPKQWPGFIFGDVADDNSKQRAELPETLLDDKGAGSVTVPFETSARSPMTVRASFSLLESGGRPVVRSIERQWWPAQAMVGLRPAFDRDVTQEGSMAEFDLIRVTSNGQWAALNQASYRLVQEKREYYWRNDPERGWHSGYTESEEIVDSGTVSLKSRTKLTVPVKWGTYRLEISDPQTQLVTRYRFYAGWNAQDTESLGNRPDRVRLQLEGAPVKPGDSVQLKILPPHDGEAIVLVEADKVLWSKRLSVSTRGTSITIPIDKSWTRSDMYISTVVLRPGSQGDRVTPARAVGLTWLPLVHDNRKLKVNLNAPAHIEPEKRMPLRVKVEGAAGKRAMVTVSAVDVGILNITRFKTPDPLDFYFGKHRFGAELTDIYGKLIERMDGQVGKLKWGGDAGMRDTRSMPKKVKLVDVFSGPVQLDAKGEAEIGLDIPDFNGTLRLMAVAYTADAYGSAEREVTVAAPVVAELSMPRFIGPGDKATVALDVSNLSGAAQQLAIKLSSDPLLRISEADRSLSLADKQRQVLRFTVEATQPYGLARVMLDLKATGAKPLLIHREFALQVQPPVPREQETRRIRLEPGASYKVDAGLVERYHRGSATLSATLSNQPPLNVRSIVKGLLEYPYGCLEQTTSAAYPHLFIDEEAAKAVGLEPRTREQRAQVIAAAISRIAGMQGSAGGFRLWGEHSGAYEAWLTPYVVGFLMDARDAGFNVPEDMHKRAQNWMVQRLNAVGGEFPAEPKNLKRNVQGRYEWRDYELLRNSHQRFAELAHIGYMLAREQKANLASLRVLHDQYRNRAYSPLPLVHLGIALQLMGDSKRANEAIAQAINKPYGIDPGWEWEYLGDYGTAVRDQALAYALLMRHNITHPQRENLLLNVSERLGQSRYFSTQERIALFLAARAASGNVNQPWQADMKIAGRSVTLGAKTNTVQSLEPAAVGQGISFTNTGSAPLWLEVQAGGYPVKAPVANSDKVALTRTWFNPDGTTWKGGPLKVGDMLIARVTASAKQIVNDGLVIDHIPAGLEVENLNLSQGPKAQEFVIDKINVAEAMSHPTIKHREYRDDRFVAAVRLDATPRHLFYLLRVVTPGTFQVPAPYAEDMYRPDIRGYGVAPEPITVVDPRGQK